MQNAERLKLTQLVNTPHYNLNSVCYSYNLTAQIGILQIILFSTGG